MSTNEFPTAAARTEQPLSLTSHIGVGLAAGVFAAACVAQTKLPHPLENTAAQIPPNLPLLAAGLAGGLAAGGSLWALRKLFRNRR
ncbi:hypothetical protein [Tardiphaga sp. 619_E2_N8_5]|uniref:hypothetical protein n=1 Tax=unclassified Tardiphaga TaxID=2631404 RepID=UPI003F268B97